MSWMRSFNLSLVGLLVFAAILGGCQENDVVRSPGSIAPPSSPEDVEPTTPRAGDGQKEPETPTKAPKKSVAEPPPPPNARLPKDPKAAAAALEKAHKRLDALVARWTSQRARPGAPVESDIELWALYQQRLYRAIAKPPGGSRAVIARAPRPVAVAARANLAAQRDLYALSQPVDPPVKLPRAQPASARELLGFFKQAEKRSGVPWYVLASVNFIETRFGRLKGPSTAGALGPMQFLPSTWERYGNGGDIYDPHDAIMGAARYLAASGAPNDMRGALYAYNNSDLYVNAILDYALQMKTDPRDFYAYYHWQVFVRTTKGDIQLTGPGKDPKV
jgi:Transglycosylase SLT domain